MAPMKNESESERGGANTDSCSDGVSPPSQYRPQNPIRPDVSIRSTSCHPAPGSEGRWHASERQHPRFSLLMGEYAMLVRERIAGMYVAVRTESRGNEIGGAFDSK